MKPLIGLPGRDNAKRETVEQIKHYLDAVLGAGGLPVIIPSMADRALVREYAERLDGLLLPGSSTDVDPVIYGAAPHPKLGRLYPERDATDLELLRHADATGMPALGICFGVQSLNVHRGGTLVQDIPSIVPAALVHTRSEKDEEQGGPARHPVRLQEGSLLASLAGGAGEARGLDVEVNSYHHQSIERLGANLKVSAVAPDGVVEAVEDTSGRFMIGVQWHPERGWKEDRLSCGLFSALVERARAFRAAGSPVTVIK